MRRLSVILLILIFAACENPLMTKVQPFTPPPIYRALYAQMEQCSGHKGDFARIQWFTAEQITQPNGKEAYGYWETDHKIFLRADIVAGPGFERLVKHEELHDIRNSKSHPKEFYPTGICGDLGT